VALQSEREHYTWLVALQSELELEEEVVLVNCTEVHKSKRIE